MTKSEIEWASLKQETELRAIRGERVTLEPATVLVLIGRLVDAEIEADELHEEIKGQEEEIEALVRELGEAQLESTELRAERGDA